MLPSREPLACYAACTKDSQLLMASSSGGAFTELARVILADGGVVFGATWEKDTFRVIHKWVDNEDALEDLRGSKYATSDLSGIYADIRRFLNAGRKVLLTGTPCQVAAIGKLFGVHPNLILCALICMANVQASVWLDYVEELQTRVGSKLVNVKHRHKSSSANGARFLAEFEDSSKNLEEPLYENKYWGIFVQSAKPCCRACQFKSGRHPADIVIGDFWQLNRFMPEIDTKNGYSAVLVYSLKGIDILKRARLVLQASSYEEVLYGNPYLEKSFVPSVPSKTGVIARIRRKLGCVLRSLNLR